MPWLKDLKYVMRLIHIGSSENDLVRTVLDIDDIS